MKHIFNRLKQHLEHWFANPTEFLGQTYLQELNLQCRKGVVAAGSIAAIAFLRHIEIDKELYPEFPELQAIRLTLSILSILAVFTFIGFKAARNYGMILWLIPGGYATLMAAFVAGVTGGDPAYLGSYIVVIMLYTIVPFPLLLSWGMLACSLMLYFAGKWYSGYDYLSTEAGLSASTMRNSFIIAFVFIFITDRLRYNSYQKSKQLQNAKSKSDHLLKQIDEELDMARKIQSALLPGILPQSNSISIASRYLPYAHLGGDFFDTYISHDKREMGFFICDVSGHGVPAALVASMVKMALSGWPSLFREPAQIISHLHFNMKSKLSTQFISAFICHLDFSTGKLTSANAGHLPMILLRNNGKIESIRPKGRIITEFFVPNSIEVTVQLQPGDYFILYTDGITEARNSSGVLFEEERFFELVRNAQGLTPDEMAERIITSVQNFAQDGLTSEQSQFNDDLTLLIARFNENSSSS